MRASLSSFCWRRGVLLVTVFALLAPLGFTGIDFDGGWAQPGWPRVCSGDEPHYLVILNSVLNDGDVDLANDYAAVHAGGLQAGKFWSTLQTLDHHTRFMSDNKDRQWGKVYDTWKWSPDHVAIPVPRPDVTIPPAGTPEHSIHPVTQAFVLAVPLYPLRGTDYVEPAALLASGLFTVAALFFFRILVRNFRADAAMIDAVSVLAFLTTPVWFYARSLFLEGTIVCFVTGAYALAWRGRWALVAGILAGLAIQYKPHFALVALPLLLEAAWRREWRRGLALGVPMAVAVALVFVTYAWLEGSPFRSPQPFKPGNPVTGLAGLLFSQRAGLLWFAPVLLPALVCWPAFVRRHGSRAVAIGAGCVLFLLLMASFADWDGGFCFGPRHLVPVLPLACVSLVMLPESWLWRRPGGKVLVVTLALVGLAMNAIGVFGYVGYFGGNPLVELVIPRGS